jgi:hypothetical protein
MVIPFLLFDLSLHLFILLFLDAHVVFLDLGNNLLPQFLLLKDSFFIELHDRSLIDVGSLHLVHREFIVDVL